MGKQIVEQKSIYYNAVIQLLEMIIDMGKKLVYYQFISME